MTQNSDSATPWTPGPWKVEDERRIRGPRNDLQPNGYLVAAVSPADEPLRRPVDVANARLIAAAPEMAEIMQRLVSARSTQRETAAFAWFDCMNDAGAVLARIRGES
jgi:hypothetical protein